MGEFDQNPVSQAVWRWRENAADALGTAGMSPRVKVLITTPIALLIAYGIYCWKHHPGPPLVVAAMALAIALCGFFAPPAYAFIERFFLRFAAWVAAAMTWILLTPVFYLIFAPAHLLLALRGKDPMHRRCPTDLASYWTPRPPITRKNYYRSQY